MLLSDSQNAFTDTAIYQWMYVYVSAPYIIAYQVSNTWQVQHKIIRLKRMEMGVFLNNNCAKPLPLAVQHFVGRIGAENPQHIWKKVVLGKREREQYESFYPKLVHKLAVKVKTFLVEEKRFVSNPLCFEPPPHSLTPSLPLYSWLSPRCYFFPFASVHLRKCTMRVRKIWFMYGEW